MKEWWYIEKLEKALKRGFDFFVKKNNLIELCWKSTQNRNVRTKNRNLIRNYF